MADFKMSMQYQVIRNQYCGVVNNKAHLYKKKVGYLDMARTWPGLKKGHSNHLNTWTGAVVTLYFHESDFGGFLILV